MRETKLTPQQTDDAIDHVAREMMDRDLEASFRARLMERLDAPRPARLTVRRLAWSAGGLAVLLLAAFVGLRTFETAPAERVAATTGPASSAGQQRPQGGLTQGNQAGPSSEAQGAAAEPTAVAANLASANQRADSSRRSAAAGEPDASGGVESWPPPLTPPAPIDLGSIAPAAIALPDIGPTPIGEIAPIPIQPTTGGPGEPQRRDDR
jgi:hypothetical protein